MRTPDSDEAAGSQPQEPLTAQEQARLEEERLEEERRYFNVSRSISASLVASLPLLAVYELGVLLAGAEINAAAALVKSPLSWLRADPISIFGADLAALINGAMILAVVGATWRLRRLGALHEGTFLGMFIESAIYALLLGPVALAPLTGEWQFAGFAPRLRGCLANAVVACGAGFYEELFYRAIVLGLTFYLAKEWAGLRPFTAGLVALVVSGGTFSAAHFLSPAEPADLGVYLYRLLAGMGLGLIFLARGFGIAAWTHALYDIYVLCLAAQ